MNSIEHRIKYFKTEFTLVRNLQSIFKLNILYII